MSPGDQSHSQDQDTVTVCREVFDTEASQPTDKGIVSVTASSRCSVQWPVSRLRDDSFCYRLIFMFCKTLSSHKYKYEIICILCLIFICIKYCRARGVRPQARDQRCRGEAPPPHREGGTAGRAPRRLETLVRHSVHG